MQSKNINTIFENFNLEYLIQNEENLVNIFNNLNEPQNINLELYLNYIKTFKYHKLYESIPVILINFINDKDINSTIISNINLQLIAVFLIFALNIVEIKDNNKINYNHLRNIMTYNLQNFYYIIQIILIKAKKEKVINLWQHHNIYISRIL